MTRFTNQSGPGGATATHTNLSVKFTGTPQSSVPLIHIVSIRTVTPDGTAVPSTCSPAVDPPAGATPVTISCSVGNVAGAQTVKLVVRFGAATNLRLDGDVTYGESGSDNPNGPNGTVNDNHSAPDFLSVGNTFDGSCFDLSGSSTAIVLGTNGSQTTQATVGQTGIAGLPCTPAAAGVLPGRGNRPSTFTRDVSFTDFLTITGNGTATVLVDFLTSLPKGFVLQELINPADPTNPLSWVPVPECPSTALDSCISGRKNLPKGGLRYIINAVGVFDDTKYSG